ncbi:MAG TPA: LuxR C-terminal-related transcriptional regulator [Candidatus Limnocylindrales bacterium]|nr:LuxR C-terminal-related transcriptional regulator [Candidatus Limnocylindrales bacterium]
MLRIFGRAPDDGKPAGQEDLTEREHQVAELLTMGFTNAAIAKRLSVTPATVSSHVAHILSKLGFRSRAMVAAWVVDRRLARPAEEGMRTTVTI